MDGRCKDCRFWDKLGMFQQFPDSHLECSQPKMCSGDEPIDGASAESENGYDGGYVPAAHINTGPSFGCVQFEAQGEER